MTRHRSRNRTLLLAFAVPALVLAACSDEESTSSATDAADVTQPSTPAPAVSEPAVSEPAVSATAVSEPAVSGPATTDASSALLADDAELVLQRDGLYVGTASGTPPSLLDGTQAGEHPDWSPDGRQLVFETNFTTLYITSPDAGAEPSEVASCAPQCVALYDGAWSPDGEEVAFVVIESDDGQSTSRASINVLSVDSGDIRTAYTDDAGDVWLFQPRWSPDATAFVVDEATFASRSLDEEQITGERLISVAADGSSTSPTALTSGDEPATNPDWSSSGDLVVFARAGNLWTVATDGTNPQQLTGFNGTTEQAIQPTFLPDGLGVVFTYVTGDGSSPEAAVIALDGETFQVLDLRGPATHVRIRPL